MFAEHLLEPADDHRAQRLSFAAVVALSLTAAGLVSAATLERFTIVRVGGPEPEVEVAAFSLLAAPELLDPPPPPPTPTGGAAPDQPAATAARPSANTRAPVADALDDGIAAPTSSATRADPSPSGRPSPLGSLGCPPGMRCEPGGGAGRFGPGPTGTCVGPSCPPATPPSVAAAPEQVSFDALRCLACADPDQLALRKLGASVGHRRGRVELGFCVDARGHVEASTVRVVDSFGVAAVDRVAAAAVTRWRFSPLKVAGTARRVCSRARFDIRFD